MVNDATTAPAVDMLIAIASIPTVEPILRDICSIYRDIITKGAIEQVDMSIAPIPDINALLFIFSAMSIRLHFFHNFCQTSYLAPFDFFAFIVKFPLYLLTIF
jgi:hypothetical protein